VTFSWVATDARTGAVIADLPYLECEKVKRSVGRYESTTASLPLPNAPENWLTATRPGGVNMILLSDGLPIWGGMVTQRPRSLDDSVPLALATLESYLDRRLMGDVTYAATGQNAMVADWFARFVTIGPRGGIPFRVAYTGAGTARDRSYLRTDRKTVYSALTELAAVSGGPEWTIEWEMSTDGSGNPHFTPVLIVGDRVGQAVTPGMAPAATFQSPGCIIDAVLTEDYSAGKGANSVIAYSSATGGDVPTSPAQVAADDGRPTFEVDIQPSTSITDVATLTAHAQAALATLAPGGAALAMSANLSTAPRLGVDWMLGDDIGYGIGGLESTSVSPFSRESVPAFPGGMSGVMRCIGWELTLDGVQVVTPILATI
jgi:hypothetical protein